MQIQFAADELFYFLLSVGRRISSRSDRHDPPGIAPSASGDQNPLPPLPATGDNAAMEAEPTKAEPPKRDRHWFQFSQSEFCHGNSRRTDTMSRNLLPVTTALFVLFVGTLLSSNPSARADDPKQLPPDKPALVLQDDDAIKELRRLGATVVAVKSPDRKSDEVSVRLGGDWHGTSDDLKLLNHVANLDRLDVFGVPFTDDDLMQLDGLSRLTAVSVYGTKVTADGAARLAKMHQDIKVDRRRTNALFGVAADDTQAGVLITVVQAGSPADRGGLTRNDIIVKFAGHDVGDFKALVSLIGNSDPGDKVTIELRRDSETLTKEVEMGSWK